MSLSLNVINNVLHHERQCLALNNVEITKFHWAKTLTTFSYSHEVKKYRCSSQPYGTNGVRFKERPKLTLAHLQ